MKKLLLWTITGFIGIAIGTFFNLWIQLGIIITFIAWINISGIPRRFTVIMGIIFVISIIIGDISYSIQTQNFKTIEYNKYNPFIVDNTL